MRALVVSLQHAKSRRNKCNYGGSFEIICNFGGFVVIMVGPGKNICNYSGSVVTLVGLVESAGQR